MPTNLARFDEPIQLDHHTRPADYENLVEGAEPPQASAEGNNAALPFNTLDFRLWPLSFACWTVVALVDVLGSHAYYLATGNQPPTWRLLLTWSFNNSYAMALLTPAIYWISQRFAFNRKHWKSSSAVHMIACGGFALTAACLTALLNSLLPWAHSPVIGSARTQIAGLFLGDAPRYILVVAITQATTYYKRYHERELAASQLEMQLAEAKLSALKMQLQPHFIFNVLNAIATLARRDPASSELMTLQLAELLRMSLQDMDVQEVPLSQELRFLECYLRIQQIRFADRLTVNVDIAPGLLDTAVPHLVLQPLVENAIRHGISARIAPGRITVSARSQEDRLTLEVRDDGPGLVFNEAGGLREGVGLRNTRARLSQIHGDDFQFSCRNGATGGCHVAISIPIRIVRNAHGKGGAHADPGVDRR